MTGRSFASFLSILVSIFLISNSLLQASPQRSIKEDIKKCPYLSSVGESEWKEIPEEIKLVLEIMVKDFKDYSTMYAVHEDKKFVFKSQTKHSRKLGWSLMVWDLKGERYLYRYDGTITSDGYQVDTVSASFANCSWLSLIADIKPEYGIPPSALGILYQEIDRIKVDEECDGTYREIDCGRIHGLPPPVTDNIYIFRREQNLHVSIGECAEYGKRIAEALSMLFSGNW